MMEGMRYEDFPTDPPKRRRPPEPPIQTNWNQHLDRILLEAVGAGATYDEAAKRIAEATGGRFAPHSTTCLRRKRVLDGAFELSTRVDNPESDNIRGRVRTTVVRSTPPSMQVIALDLEAVDRHGLHTAVQRLFYAETPGWSWSIVQGGVGDAEACARHRAALRDEEIVVDRIDQTSAMVSVCGKLDRQTRRFIVVTVRHTKDG